MIAPGPTAPRHAPAGGDAARIARPGSIARRVAAVGVALAALLQAPGPAVGQDADPSDRYRIVDCLLPPQLVRQGEQSVRFTPSKLVRLSARLCAQQGGSQKAGLGLWIDVASSGNADAQAYLGEMYQQGIGGAPQDLQQAIAWYEKAARQGNARAISSLAMLYGQGAPGVPRDEQRATELLKQSMAATGVDTRSLVVVPAAPPVPAGVAPSTGRPASGPAPVPVPVVVQDPAPVAANASVIDQSLRQFAFGNYHALMIGNSDYQNMPKLASPVHEIDVIARVLESRYGFRVRKLKNATKEQILKTLDDYNETLKADDNLLVYYSGHGAETENGQGWWIPVDGEGVQSSNRFRTRLWVSTSDVRDHLSTIRSRHVLVVSDSCYSARFLQFRGEVRAPQIDPASMKVYLDNFAKVYASRSRVALTSGGLAPVLEPTDGSNMSLFARAFVSHLERNREVIPSVNVFASIQREVMENTFKIGFPQQPQWGIIDGSGHESGDFYFRPR